MKNNKDQLSSGITSKKEKTMNIIVFILLALGAVVMVFPFFYMVMTSFMTKNQYLSGQLRV
ncbi:MAG: carbohydrate ABC transporter permease, partial [Lachnospiraceae bacterium]|nr:carbohydrate ABC transporter permease [Lachnospiraceae bacterium]